MEWISRTDMGKLREVQEDAIGVWPETNPKLFVVADGLGGHPDGEIASQTAVRVVLERAETGKGFKTSRRLKNAFEEAARQLWFLNKEKIDSDRMATTLTTACFQDEALLIAHVGDSRIYRYRDASLKQITTDHAIGPHTLTQALGLDQKLDIHDRRVKVKKDDLYMICSDGVHGMVNDQEIEDILGRAGNLQNTASILLKEALKRGEDNISFFLIKF